MLMLLLSGGLDSTTLLYSLLANGRAVRCVSFYYGQRHGARELAAATHFARLSSGHEIIDLSSTGVFGPSALTGETPMPFGHHSDESMRQTVVANRNMLMLAVAASRAIAHGCGGVAYAAHAGDAAVYPDCRPAFVDAMRAALAVCDWQALELVTPFLTMTKLEIYAEAVRLDVAVDRTWSCYVGGAEPCGRCGACSGRAEAMGSAL